MILVLGATGFLGRRLCRKLDAAGLEYEKTSLSLGCDLRDPRNANALFDSVRPTFVLNCAAYVGGIQFGLKHTAELFSNNLMMTVNILDAAVKYGVTRIVNPISNCAYPAKATLFHESEFWDGSLHESVLVYGFVRKASWVGAWAYARQYGLDQVNLILSNMYGPEDHFQEERSHAMGALIMKIIEAKRQREPEVIVWGSGKPVREWLYIDDGAEAMIRAMHIAPYGDPINIGIAKGISVIEMAEMIKRIVGYKGSIVLDPLKPDGAPYKTVDGSLGTRLLEWTPKTGIEDGIRQTVEWYIENR